MESHRCPDCGIELHIRPLQKTALCPGCNAVVGFDWETYPRKETSWKLGLKKSPLDKRWEWGGVRYDTQEAAEEAGRGNEEQFGFGWVVKTSNDPPTLFSSPERRNRCPACGSTNLLRRMLPGPRGPLHQSDCHECGRRWACRAR